MKWLWSTPWPVYALTMLQANIFGAVFVFAFLRFVLPIDEIVDMGEFRFLNQYLFIGYLGIAFFAGLVLSTVIILPVLREYRAGEEFSFKVRQRVIRIPFYQSIIAASLWAIGTTIFVLVNLGFSTRLALIVGVTSILGASSTGLISYLQAERIMRPITVLALSQGVPSEVRVPGIRRRIFLGWGLTTMIPVFGVLLVLAGQWVGLFGDDPTFIFPALIVLGSLAVIAGAVGMSLVSDSIADPVRELMSAVMRVEKGDLDARVTIYDSSEIGQLG
ncbi:MAG: HAMP domain-containing protein, partial [Actinomycetia bacterium]|nr:HAMP domain-containing protein [Actinomycetes bacterium]